MKVVLEEKLDSRFYSRFTVSSADSLEDHVFQLDDLKAAAVELLLLGKSALVPSKILDLLWTNFLVPAVVFIRGGTGHCTLAGG